MEDPIILLYIEESVQCFLSVMLGVAAEAVFYQLFEWMKKNATNPTFKSRIERAEKQVNSFKNKQDVIFNEIKQHKGLLDTSLTGNIETNLDGIGTFMRLQRNDSGHPTGIKKSRDEMFVNLRLFVPYCRQIYDLLDWFEQKRMNNTFIF